jgi:aspartyl-tRNA(Asn)/glutamyl-tRNA(Gln) amidotransferase subunit A
MPADALFLGIRELGRRYRQADLSPVEVVQGALRRIDRHGPALNAWVTVRKDDALADAAVAEAELRAGKDRGPLHGVPVAIKDNIDTRGLRTTCGARIYRDRIPDRDATVVARLKQAGAITMGKTNLLEFAYGVVHPDFGQCNNPWDLKRTSGGSSSGSASAVAAGMVFAALGTDTGGSIRIPAAYCGIVGFKPTYGAVSRTGVFPLSWTLDHVGPLARTVDDAALAFAAIAGEDPSDGTSVASPCTTGWEPRGTLVGLRVGVAPELLGDELQPGVAAAFEHALSKFRGAGAHVQEVRLPTIHHSEDALMGVIAAEAASIHEPLLRAHADDYSDKARAQLQMGTTYLAVDYLRALRYRTVLIEEFRSVFSLVDVLICPTTPHVAPAENPHPGVAGRGRTRVVRRTGPFNLAGLPAVSVPAGLAEDRMPVGLQIAAPWLQDQQLLQTALAFERVSEWQSVAPPGVI